MKKLLLLGIVFLFIPLAFAQQADIRGFIQNNSNLIYNADINITHDNSSNSFEGIITGTVVTSTDNFVGSNALDVDRTGKNEINFTQFVGDKFSNLNYTWCAWAKSDTGTVGAQYIVSRRDTGISPFFSQLTWDGGSGFVVWATSEQGGTSIEITQSTTLNAYQHICGVANQTTGTLFSQLYLNGTLVASNSGVLVQVLNVTLDIGESTHDADANNGFQGVIDEVIIMNFSATSDDIETLFQLGVNGTSLGFIAEAEPPAEIINFTAIDIRTLSPVNNTVTNITVTDLGYFINISDETVSLFVNNTFNQSQTSTSGNNNFTIVITINQTLFWDVRTTINNTDFNSGFFNINVNQTFIEPIVDNPPTFGASSNNNTNPRINQDILLSQVVDDDIALDWFVFSHNQSGSFVNQTLEDISGLSFNLTHVLTIILPRDNVIGYQWFVNDTSNNINISEIASFTVANTPPEDVTIIAPDTFFERDQPLEFNVTFPSDADSDVLTINWYIDGVLNQSTITNTTFNATDAIYILNVSVFDGVDSSPNNATFQFNLDTVNPLITINSPTNNSFHATDIPVALVCDNINVVNLSYIFHNSSNIIQTEFNATTDITQSTLNIPILTSGLGNNFYNFNVSCLDNATNVANTFLRLNFDNIAPLVISTSIDNSTPQEDNTVLISATCNDNFVGIDRIDVANNVTGELINVSGQNFGNISGDQTNNFNHTVVLGSIVHQFTCRDGLQNSVQTGFIQYNSSEAPEAPLIAITGNTLAGFPVNEFTNSLITIIILFFVLVLVVQAVKGFRRTK